jgi:hypothetical protein
MKHTFILLIIIVINSVMMSCSEETETKIKKDNTTVQTSKTEAKKETKIGIKKAKQAVNNRSDANTALISDFLQNVNSLTDVKDPIGSFVAEADKLALDKAIITVDNIKDVLAKAKQYSNMVIVVGKHTVIKITDLDKCITSGSWKTCMPFAKGFIKRSSKLVYKEDYSNNIIGIPDTQSRIAYFF